MELQEPLFFPSPSEFIFSVFSDRIIAPINHEDEPAPPAIDTTPLEFEIIALRDQLNQANQLAINLGQENESQIKEKQNNLLQKAEIQKTQEAVESLEA